MVVKNSGVTRCEGISVIPRALVLVTSSAAVLSLMHGIFPGGDGRRRIVLFAEASGGGSGLFVSSSNVEIAVAVTAMAGLALAATLVYSRRGSLKSPWSRRRRKRALLAKQWKSLFDVDGKLSDGGVRLLKKIRTGGVEPSIRTEVWPFLLGMYDVKSTKKERDSIKAKKRKEYIELRKKCCQISKRGERSFKLKDTSGNNSNNEEGGGMSSPVINSPGLNQIASSRHYVLTEIANSREPAVIEEDESVITNENFSEVEESESPSSDPDSESDSVDTKPLISLVEEDTEEDDPENLEQAYNKSAPYKVEDFTTWQRIIRLDSIRANSEWIIYSPSQATVSEAKAQQLAETVGLKDYDHLEPCRIYHAARLVSILEAYALYDPEIGYCQGMSDLLSPIISVIEEDHVAFCCFAGFMRKARHNFRLDEVGIRRQLTMVSKIIKCKDSHLYRHLEKLEAEDCFFVYRMVVVLFRRELTFEQTLCLWEVMWADQAAIRAGIVKSAWQRMKLRAPPTEDLLLYAIAACVLQKRKPIMENYSSMDEIMRDCNSMAGHLDVWKLLDAAHDLVVTLNDKI